MDIRVPAAREAKIERVHLELTQTAGLAVFGVRGTIQDDRNFLSDFSVDGRGRKPTAAAKFDGDELDISRVVAVTLARGLVEGEMELEVDLRGEGDSPRKLADSLDGSLLALVRAGSADVRQLETLLSSDRALVGQLEPPQFKVETTGMLFCG